MVKTMSKRLTDTEKWSKPFIRGLDTTHKLFWIYITDTCDHAGIWQVDMEVASIRVGTILDEQKAIEMFGDKIHVFHNGEKWFIPDFIAFQYSVLNPDNKVHASVLKNLEKYGIKHLASPFQGPIAKDKDKDKEMVYRVEKYSITIQEAVKKWYTYKKDRGETYKSQDSFDAMVSSLIRLCGGNENNAMPIVEQSMANNWAGLFELKTKLVEKKPFIIGQHNPRG